MKEHYVTYRQAVKLKELGFDWECLYFYPIASCLGIKRNCSHANFNSFEMSFNCDKYVEIFSAPRLDQAQAWLREAKGLHIQVRINGVRSAYWYEIWSTTPNGPVYGTPDDDTFRQGQYDDYESALSAGIDKALELLTNNTDK